MSTVGLYDNSRLRGSIRSRRWSPLSERAASPEGDNPHGVRVPPDQRTSTIYRGQCGALFLPTERDLPPPYVGGYGSALKAESRRLIADLPIAGRGEAGYRGRWIYTNAEPCPSIVLTGGT
jgi:hypothetical protein